MTLLGSIALWLALLMGLWGAVTGFVGGLQGRSDLQRSARHAVFAMFAALAVAVICLEVAIFQHDFNVAYVAGRTSRNLPTFYLWSALYSGQEGSLLFWATVLSLFAALAQVLTSARHRPYLPFVAAVTCLVASFFVAVMRFAPPNPSARLPYTPEDGAVVALPVDRAADRDVVGIRGAWVGRVLGVGSRRKRGLAAVAHDDGVPPLRDDPGEARDAEEVEPGV